MATTKTTPAAPKAPKAKKEAKLNSCGCGCGTTCKGRFAPGHDAKLKSSLLQIHRNGGLSAAQRKQVAELGWEKHMTDGKPKAAPKPTLPGGVNEAQLNILRALSTVHPKGLTRKELAEKVGDINWSKHLGYTFVEDRNKYADKHAASLLGKGLVTLKTSRGDKDQEINTWFLNAAGKKVVDKAKIR